jgi:hypothetical protein
MIERGLDGKGSLTRRMYFTRVLYGIPFTTTPVMFWSSFGTMRCAVAVAASKAR